MTSPDSLRDALAAFITETNADFDYRGIEWEADAIIDLLRAHRTETLDALGFDTRTDHVVVLEPESFSIQHPLTERLDGSLFDCELHARLGEADGPPHGPGRYSVTFVGDEWVFRAVSGGVDLTPASKKETT